MTFLLRRNHSNTLPIIEQNPILLVCVWEARLRFPNACFAFSAFFFFFFPHVSSQFFIVHSLLRLLFINSSRNIWLFSVNSARCTLFTDPQILFFSHFLLKMGHTVLFTHLKFILLQYFSVFSFSFQLYLNGPLVCVNNSLIFLVNHLWWRWDIRSAND